MDQVIITPLGAGCQVGRSCIILQYAGKKIMLDCGLHMSKYGQDSKPYFDQIDPGEISLILITHSHLDHCGALPIFLANTAFKGRVLMTRPTKQIYQYLLHDSIKVRSQNIKLFGSEQIKRSVAKIQTIDYDQQIEHQGIRVIPYCAGHVLGAAMFLVRIGQISVLYTGDYSCQQDRYIKPAQIPQIKVDILIVQSTYGTKEHQPRPDRQRRFTSKVQQIVKRGGKCLLPVFAVGRAQELLMMLQQHWSARQQQLSHVKIYYTCALIQKCKHVYRSYISMLSKTIQNRFYKQQSDPFHFRFIHWLQSNSFFNKQSVGPLVAMCSPGMLQSGQSRLLLQKWCHSPLNGLILTGYCVQGSLADNLRKGNMIRNRQGVQLQVKMDVQVISFSAHADCKQTTQFIKAIQPQFVVLVHGSQKNAKALQKHLKKQFDGKIQSIVAPQNCHPQKFKLSKKHSCYVAGSLRKQILLKKNQIKIQQGMIQEIPPLQVQGFLMKQNDKMVLMGQQDFYKIRPTKQIKVFNQLKVPFGGTLDLVVFLAQHVFGKQYKIIDQQPAYADVQGIKIILSNGKALLKWKQSSRLDVIADQFSFLLFQFPSEQYDIFHEQYIPQ